MLVTMDRDFRVTIPDGEYLLLTGCPKIDVFYDLKSVFKSRRGVSFIGLCSEEEEIIMAD